MSDRFIGQREKPRLGGPILIGVVLLVALFCSRYIASTLVDYAWWSEVGQRETWLNLLLYGTVPLVIVSILFFAAFWTAFSVGVRHDSSSLRARSKPGTTLSRLAFIGLAIVAVLAANLTVDNWTIVRFFGGQRLPAVQSGFVDPIFGKPLTFYFFGLPFYNQLLHVILTAVVLSLAIYWISAHYQTLMDRIPSMSGDSLLTLDGRAFRSTLDTTFVRLAGAVLLTGLAIKFYFSRYEFLAQDHGPYLVGIDWVADHVVLPLQWMMIVGALLGALLIVTRKLRWALLLLVLLPVRYVLPPLIQGVYVRPNELALERPYIGRHIVATRSAFAIDRKVTETKLDAQAEIPIDYSKHKPLLDNVRLWDWRAFHDTVTQIQPLRPYIYIDSDVDRYQIDGQLRQILIAPRELQISQLGEARNSWINPHFVYTHGYGIVMAEANQITADGLPVLFIKNAPPEVASASLKLTKPEIYYGEAAHEPVFVDTNQPEFNYPSGTESVHTRYSGTGGFSVSSLLMRMAAALEYGDLNILITSNLTPDSRMMIRRSILPRLTTLAGFITWDSDPYLVLTESGRLVWIVDGYMTSDAHPYSRRLELGSGQSFNYMRNSVKATIDAYTGESNLYVFDPGDVLIQAYARLFPELFKPASAMPADLRAHTRYPETLFSAQAEIYRNFHMRDPEAFYNRADLWDLAKTSSKQGESAGPITPTYVVATMPGETKPEFMLITEFTPANKDNLIGVMLARCDGEHLGELVFQQLSKQNIIFGPMQIEARINQDQNISKDLTLWNQQGSQVLRGQTLILPIDKSFLYVAPIYIQASQASMPQLKKVALAMGNKLAYADTYQQALSQLISASEEQPQVTQRSMPEGQTNAPQQSSIGSQTTEQSAQVLNQVREHLRLYRSLNAQGKWAEAGRELEQIQKLLEK